MRSPTACRRRPDSLQVAIRASRRGRSGILWRPDVVVTSEQVLPQGTDFGIVHNGTEIAARLAGRDAGTNVAVLRLAKARGNPSLPAALALTRAGSLALVVGADPRGKPTGRLGMVHAMAPNGTARPAAASRHWFGWIPVSAPTKAGRC